MMGGDAVCRDIVMVSARLRQKVKEGAVDTGSNAVSPPSNCSIVHYKRSVVYVLCLPKMRERADVVVERVWNGNKTTCPSIVACANSC